MIKYQVLSWRGIPAQIRASENGKKISKQLPTRFQNEIDRIAMKEGLFGSEEYLNGWSWSDQILLQESLIEVLDIIIEDLVSEWDKKLFKKNPTKPNSQQ